MGPTYIMHRSLPRNISIPAKIEIVYDANERRVFRNECQDGFYRERRGHRFAGNM